MATATAATPRVDDADALPPALVALEAKDAESAERNSESSHSHHRRHNQNHHHGGHHHQASQPGGPRRPGSAPPVAGTRKAKKSRGERDLVKMVCVSDAGTGTVLFERGYRWSEALQAWRLGALVQTFYQFTREVGGGDVVSVDFEGNSTAPHRRATSSLVRNRAIRPPAETMKMVTTRGRVCVASAFYDTRGGDHRLQPGALERLQQYVQEVLVAFEERFAPEVDAMQAELQELAKNDTTKEEQTALQERFAAFLPTAEEVRTRVLPAHTSGPQHTPNAPSAGSQLLPALPLTGQLLPGPPGSQLLPGPPAGQLLPGPPGSNGEANGGPAGHV